VTGAPGSYFRLPAARGAIGGAWLALDVDDREFRRIPAVLMVAVTLWTVILKGHRWREHAVSATSIVFAVLLWLS
jgi:uncharacterized membrane protein YfcA